MKIYQKIALGLSLALTPLTTLAADIDPVAEPVSQAHDWSGPYFGVQGGGIFGSNTVLSTPAAAPLVFLTGSDFTSGLGGIFGGFNFQNAWTTGCSGIQPACHPVRSAIIRMRFAIFVSSFRRRLASDA